MSWFNQLTFTRETIGYSFNIYDNIEPTLMSLTLKPELCVSLNLCLKKTKRNISGLTKCFKNQYNRTSKNSFSALNKMKRKIGNI